MRNGQQKRMRGRNRNRGHNPLTRVYESNGPEVKVRGTAHHIAEKYMQLARDAQASGDPIAAEGYLQHAEHYFRLIAAAQAQFQQQNPHQPQQPYQRPDMDARDEFEEGEGEGDEAPVNPNAQPYPGGGPVAQPQLRQQPQPPQPQPQPNFQGYPQQPRGGEQHSGGLPAFITGGGAPSGNGYDNEQGDRGGRFGRDRNRHRHFRHGGHQGHQGQGGQQGGHYEQRGQQSEGQRQPAPQPDQNATPAEGTTTPTATPTPSQDTSE
jgi:Domain of unknown function (DUF4167)